ncbi:MAG TPA: helix-turn-helix domain-containing protein [Nevskiales bacterium]|nr:helix-turn-helix domain-containing protein [Nevskiales bacterium]
MQRTSFADMPCSIARTLDVVGEWWTLLIIRDIFNGVRRFDDLLDHLGISRNILTDRLNSLVDKGVLKRARYQERPARYEYRLTEKGLDLLPILLLLMRWGDKWQAGEAGAPVTVIHTDCGHETSATVVCSACGQPLIAGHLHLRVNAPAA